VVVRLAETAASAAPRLAGAEVGVKGKDLAFWKKQIESAESAAKPYEPWAEANLRAYAPSPNQDPATYGNSVNTNRDFVLVERKKADLFYQRPDVTLQPSPLLDGPILTDQVDPTTGQPVPLMGPNGQPVGAHLALAAHQLIVNEELGPDGIDATRMAHQALFDVLCTQGTGFTKMGYESVTVDVEEQDPAWSPDPLIPPDLQTPKTIKVPVPIYERCFWHHFSGKKALIPADFRSTEWDKAPWLGYRFELPLTKGNREAYKLPATFEGSKTDGKQYYDHGLATPEGQDLFTGVEIWYHSSLFRDDIKHPEHFTRLVIVDGVDEAVIEEDSPYQSFDAKGGLTPDSLLGNPIHPLSIRVLTDSAHPPSDCTVIRPLVNELNRFREQMVEYRDAQTLKWMYNTDTMPPDALGKIVRAPVGGMIGVPGDVFVTDGIKELPHGSMPRESFTSNDYIDNDIARTTAIDAAGSGVQSAVNQTATEAQIQQGNANARLDFERGVVLQWYTRGVTKYSTLIQRYLPTARAAQIVGPAKAQMWELWKMQVPSSLAFTAMPDSALRVDQAIDRKTAQDLYSFLANDPYVNRGELLTRLLRKFHLDPSTIVKQPEPPKPEPPKLALSFKGEDFVAPQGVIVLGILEQLGVKIDPSWVTISQAMAQQNAILAAQAEAADAEAKANTKHGGKAPQQESLSKHAADQTGGMQNTGAPAALGAGGGMIQ
jgi:hypothetical protein